MMRTVEHLRVCCLPLIYYCLLVGIPSTKHFTSISYHLMSPDMNYNVSDGLVRSNLADFLIGTRLYASARACSAKPIVRHLRSLDTSASLNKQFQYISFFRYIQIIIIITTVFFLLRINFNFNHT